MAEGDERTVFELYRRHQGMMFHYALVLCGSDALAADATRGPLHAYLLGIARNLMRRQQRFDEKHQTLEDEFEHDLPPVPIDDDGPLTRLMDAERRELVRVAGAQLPLHYRECRVLCELARN